MENNREYLRRMPAVLLIAALLGLLQVLLPSILLSDAEIRNRYIIQGSFILYKALFFVSLGIVTRNWTAATVAFATAVLFHIGGMLIFKRGFSYPQFAYFQLSSIIPVLIFLFTLHKRTLPAGKLVITIILLLIVGNSYINTPLYVREGTVRIYMFSMEASSYWYKLLIFISAVLPFLLQILFTAEIVNYNDGKSPQWKPRLLNLGNDYPNSSSVVILIILNLWMAILFFQGYDIIQASIRYATRGAYISYTSSREGIYASIIKHSLTHIPFLLLYAWYYRKFLLEYFINYGYSSKLLYWLCYIPFIGSIALLIATTAGKQRKTYAEKSQVLSAFASSNGNHVLAAFCILLLFQALTGLIVTAIISVLFLSLVANSRGFLYFYTGLNMAVLVAITIYSLSGRAERHGLPYAGLYGLISLNMVSLVMLMPVFHIYAFEFTPDHDPDLTIPADGDLFPEYSRFS